MEDGIYTNSIWTDKSIYNSGENAHINSTYVKGDYANITIHYQNGTLIDGPNKISAINNEIKYNWVIPTGLSGIFRINVIDDSYKNLNSEKEIKVI